MWTVKEYSHQEVALFGTERVNTPPKKMKNVLEKIQPTCANIVETVLKHLVV